MANRYWVGGTGNWSDDDNHWATSSGGTPANGNLPTSLDDVFIDSNSGFGSGGTITLDSEAYLHNLTCSSGHSYTFDGIFNFWCYGDVIFESGITYSVTGEFVVSGDEARNITTNGCVLYNFSSSEDDYSGEAILLDDLEITGTFYFCNGSFDANDHNVTVNDFYFYADIDFTPTLIMGSGTWEMTGEEAYFYIEQYSDEVVTFTPETSTIKLTGANQQLFFYDDTGNETGKTFNNLWIIGTDSITTIVGSNTFNEFKVTNAPHTVKFAEETTTTVTTFTTVGADGNLITLDAYKVPSAPSGIELATNGTFTGNADDWALGTSWAYNLNNVIHTPGVEYFGWVSQAVAVEAGKTYRISANVGGNAGYVVLGYGSEASPYNNSNQINAGSGMVYWDFTAYGDLTHILIGGSYLFNGTIDNVSFQELVGDPLTQFTLSKSSGIVECDYLDISNSNATGGATWYAGSHSVDTANNDGWLFEDSGLSDSSERTLYLQGQDTANSERGLYLSGKDISYGERNLYLEAYDESYGERGLYLSGKVVTQAERSIYLSGISTSSSERSLYLEVVSTGTSERSLYVGVVDTDSSERNLYLIGSIDDSGERSLYLEGSINEDSERNLYVVGGLDNTSERGLYLTGSLDTSSERSLYITGSLDNFSERSLYLTGSLPGESKRGLYLGVVDTGSSERSLYLGVVSEGTSERSLYVTGSLDSDSERSLYLSGRDTSSSERNLYLTGSTTDSSERSLYLDVVNTGDSQRGLYITGCLSDNSERTLYLSVNQIGSSERGMWLHGGMVGTPEVYFWDGKNWIQIV